MLLEASELDPLEPELQAVVGQLTWVMRIELRSPAGSTSPLNYSAISPVP